MTNVEEPIQPEQFPPSAPLIRPKPRRATSGTPIDFLQRLSFQEPAQVKISRENIPPADQKPEQNSPFIQKAIESVEQAQEVSLPVSPFWLDALQDAFFESSSPLSQKFLFMEPWEHYSYELANFILDVNPSSTPLSRKS